MCFIRSAATFELVIRFWVFLQQYVVSQQRLVVWQNLPSHPLSRSSAAHRLSSFQPVPSLHPSVSTPSQIRWCEWLSGFIACATRAVDPRVAAGRNPGLSRMLRQVLPAGEAICICSVSPQDRCGNYYLPPYFIYITADVVLSQQTMLWRFRSPRPSFTDTKI